MNYPQQLHRALVTYSNERTGEIRVKIPALTGLAEVSISYVGRKTRNSIWIVPAVGDQIIVGGDDQDFTNLFWVQTGDDNPTRHYRNYAQFLKTDTQAFVPVAGPGNRILFNTPVYQSGMRLLNNGDFYFDYDGTYNMSVSMQYQNISTQIQDSVVWVTYNDAPYPNSATYTHIPSSHGGIPGSAVTTFNIIGEAKANSYVSLRFLANSNTVRLSSIPATSGVVPNFGQPDAPAVIVTFNQIA